MTLASFLLLRVKLRLCPRQWRLQSCRPSVHAAESPFQVDWEKKQNKNKPKTFSCVEEWEYNDCVQMFFTFYKCHQHANSATLSAAFPHARLPHAGFLSRIIFKPTSLFFSVIQSALLWASPLVSTLCLEEKIYMIENIISVFIVFYRYSYLFKSCGWGGLFFSNSVGGATQNV